MPGGWNSGTLPRGMLCCLSAHSAAGGAIGRKANIELTTDAEYRQHWFRLWKMLGVGLLILVLLLLAIVISPFGQAISRARQFDALKEQGVSIRFDKVTERSWWQTYLPDEGIATPLSISADAPLSAEQFDVLAEYSSWQGFNLETDADNDEALRQLIAQSRDLQYLLLSGKAGSRAIPDLSQHAELQQIELNLPNCDASVLSSVASAPAVLGLKLQHITDAGLPAILQIRTLKYLQIAESEAITSAPFISAGTIFLDTLEMSGSQFDDAGFRAVLKWPNLRNLYIDNAVITDVALAGLTDEDGQRLTGLSVLHSNVTDASLSQLVRLPRLDFVNLTGCRITDEKLELLNDLPALHYLLLNECPITDAGVQKLRSPRLTSLWLQGTAITAKAFDNLKQRLPKLHYCDVSDCEISADEARVLVEKYPGIGFPGIPHFP